MSGDFYVKGSKETVRFGGFDPDWAPCPGCGGDGRVETTDVVVDGGLVGIAYAPCGTCGGSGDAPSIGAKQEPDPPANTPQT